eukprot:262793-Rhodomonas_salina.2
MNGEVRGGREEGAAHQLARAVAVEALHGEDCDDGAPERAPHGLWREVARHLLQTEQHAPDRRPERHADASRCCA